MGRNGEGDFNEVHYVVLEGRSISKLFFEAEDYYRLMNMLFEKQTRLGYSVYAFCLFDNSIHIMLETFGNSVEDVINNIEDEYQMRYRVKYSSANKIFKSKKRIVDITDERMFLMFLRYIVQMPIGLGICEEVGMYNYSSFKMYFQDEKLCRLDMERIDSYFKSNIDLYEFLSKSEEINVLKSRKRR